MTDRELLEQALEALEEISGGYSQNLIAALRDRLAQPEPAPGYCQHCKQYTIEEPLPAQPEQEPVAWLYPEGLAALKAGKCWTAYGTKQDENNIPIYDAVAPRVEPRASESGAGFESLPASPDKQPEQEPMAWVTGWHDGHCVIRAADPALILPIGAALYTAPPRREWVGLTDEEIDQGLVRTDYVMQAAGAWRDGVEWAQAQLKEKNNG